MLEGLICDGSAASLCVAPFFVALATIYTGAVSTVLSERQQVPPAGPMDCIFPRNLEVWTSGTPSTHYNYKQLSSHTNIACWYRPWHPPGTRKMVTKALKSLPFGPITRYLGGAASHVSIGLLRESEVTLLTVL